MGHHLTRAQGPAAVILAGALAVTACGSGGGGRNAAGGLSVPATSSLTTSAAAPSVPAASLQTPSPATPAAAVTPSVTADADSDTTSSPPSGCASLATRTFLHVTNVKPAPGGALTLTANPATLVCGGPDDLHYNVAATTVTAHVAAGASIQVFPVSRMRYKSLPDSGLARYLATDADTRIFLVTGPLTAITALAEQFHP
jgi:hypothetical protein